jgi:two-component system LytT family response regulator
MRRVVLVDDERLARRELRSLLGAYPEVMVVGEAETLRTAAEVIRATDADTVFLDIQLGDESGLDLLPRLDPGIAVIFVTAYDHYAIRAFELHALDYLLKPVSRARLAHSIERLADPDPPPPLPESAEAALGYDDFLFLRLDGRMRFLKIRTIVAIVADANYTTLQLPGGERVRARKALNEWEARLPASEFVRIHRSAMVNLNFVERVEDWFQSSFLVYLKGDREPLHMSRRYATALRDRRG